MHYYQYNIANYRKRTGHLTLVEHGIYRSLMDTYYLDESPLEADDKKLMRLHKIRTLDEKESFHNVIEEFFYLEDGYYKHVDIEENLVKIYSKSDKARASAEIRWELERAKKAKKIAESIEGECERIGKGCERIESGCEDDATGMLPTTQDLIPNTQDLNENKHSSKPVIPYKKITDSYNLICKGLPAVKILTDKRKTRIKVFWNKSAEYQNIEFYEKYFDLVNKIPFLNGIGSENWKADLEWLLNLNNYAKVIEGKYINSLPFDKHDLKDIDYGKTRDI